jgi:hypothetical protein
MELEHPFQHILEHGRIQRIDDMLPFSLIPDKAGMFQNIQMVGDAPSVR